MQIIGNVSEILPEELQLLFLCRVLGLCSSSCLVPHDRVPCLCLVWLLGFQFWFHFCPVIGLFLFICSPFSSWWTGLFIVCHVNIWPCSHPALTCVLDDPVKSGQLWGATDASGVGRVPEMRCDSIPVFYTWYSDAIYDLLAQVTQTVTKSEHLLHNNL